MYVYFGVFKSISSFPFSDSITKDFFFFFTDWKIISGYFELYYLLTMFQHLLVITKCKSIFFKLIKLPKLLTLNVSRDLTLVARALLMHLSNCKSTLAAKWVGIWPYCHKIEKLKLKTVEYNNLKLYKQMKCTCTNSSKLSCNVFPNVVFLYNWYVIVKSLL